jgi:iron(III) transport system substrate-binding protein
MRSLMLHWRRLGVAVVAALCVASAAYGAEPNFVPPPDLLAAAKKEGKIVLYTANFLDTEQAVSKRFGERFPGIQIEIVRAPTGQLITRIKTEAAANRIIADVIDISDRVQARGMLDLFAPYAPPNAADYPDIARTADRLWPRSGNAWTITYNSALVTDPPKSWADLVKPEFGKLRLGQTVIASGGAPFNRAMFERKMFGEDYWTKQAALKPALFPSQAPMVDAMIRGEIAIAPLVTNLAIPLASHGVLGWNRKGWEPPQRRQAVPRLGTVAGGAGADGRAGLVLRHGAGADAAWRGHQGHQDLVFG